MELKHYQFTKEHEWVFKQDNFFLVGISQYAIDELGEIVFVDLPDVGNSISQGEEFGSIESVKTVSSLYMPIKGEVIEINQTLTENPELVNQSPYDKGWFVKISSQETLTNLLSFDEYNDYLKSL